MSLSCGENHTLLTSVDFTITVFYYFYYTVLYRKPKPQALSRVTVRDEVIARLQHMRYLRNCVFMFKFLCDSVIRLLHVATDLVC